MLAKVGGFDLVGMTGVMLGAASCGLPVYWTDSSPTHRRWRPAALRQPFIPI
nr:nicotinate-nucleotide-dimethylbenzimidazole phosphoribosyltransferase [Raoultella sp. NCTC 9187]